MKRKPAVHYIRFNNGGHIVPIPECDLELMLKSGLCYECDKEGKKVNQKGGAVS